MFQPLPVDTISYTMKIAIVQIVSSSFVMKLIMATSVAEMLALFNDN